MSFAAQTRKGLARSRKDPVDAESFKHFSILPYYQPQTLSLGLRLFVIVARRRLFLFATLSPRTR